MISISAITFLKEKKLYEKFLKWQKDKQKDTYAQRKAYYKDYNTKRKLAKQQDEINKISEKAQARRIELKITPYVHDGKTCLRCGNKKGSKETCSAWGTSYSRHIFK